MSFSALWIVGVIIAVLVFLVFSERKKIRGLEAKQHDETAEHEAMLHDATDGHDMPDLLQRIGRNLKRDKGHMPHMVGIIKHVINEYANETPEFVDAYSFWDLIVSIGYHPELRLVTAKFFNWLIDSALTSQELGFVESQLPRLAVLVDGAGVGLYTDAHFRLGRKKLLLQYKTTN